MHNENNERSLRGGLTVLPASLADFTCDCFAVLYFTETEFEETNITARETTFFLHRPKRIVHEKDV